MSTTSVSTSTMTSSLSSCTGTYLTTPNFTVAGTNIWPSATTASISMPLVVAGDATINGALSVNEDIQIKGKSLADTLAAIESRLAILHTRPDLEERWEKLRILGDQYRAMEQEVLEGEKLFEILSS